MVEEGKIIRLVFAQGITVTLPAPIGSRSSLDLTLHKCSMEYHPRGVRVTAPGMTKYTVIPYAQICNIDEALEPVEVKRGPGRPSKPLDAAS